MIDYEELVNSLPDPTRDSLPPRVGFTPEGAAQAARDNAFKKSLLNTKRDTERLAKYILEGPLFRGSFRKDGDWVTIPGGREVYQKKVSDFIGNVPWPTRPNAACYVEVKGVSPGQSFAFSRLDKRTNPNKPSQQEKLQVEWDRGNLVWLFIGWWDSDADPVSTSSGARTVRKWRKEDCQMTGTLLQWDHWMEIYSTHKRRSLRQKDRPMLDRFRIYKLDNRWLLDDNHWWIPCL